MLKKKKKGSVLNRTTKGTDSTEVAKSSMAVSQLMAGVAKNRCPNVDWVTGDGWGSQTQV